MGCPPMSSRKRRKRHDPSHRDLLVLYCRRLDHRGRYLRASVLYDGEVLTLFFTSSVLCGTPPALGVQPATAQAKSDRGTGYPIPLGTPKPSQACPVDSVGVPNQYRTQGRRRSFPTRRGGARENLNLCERLPSLDLGKSQFCKSVSHALQHKRGIIEDVQQVVGEFRFE